VGLLVSEEGTPQRPGWLEVGVSKRDTYTDRNGNGRFDAVWLAGFHSDRPASGVHDPLWVRALALRKHGVTLFLVSIDNIGIFHQEFIRVRKSLPKELDVDVVLFPSKHIHEVPDTMGLWSWPLLVFSLDRDYMERVRCFCLPSIRLGIVGKPSRFALMRGLGRSISGKRQLGIRESLIPVKYVIA